MDTQALFDARFDLDDIATLRVNRLEVRVRGIQTAVARVALGGSRTQVWLTLQDGRQLTSVARDAPEHAQALEAFLQAAEVARLARWEAALGRGETVQVGKVRLSADELQVGGRAVRWDRISGWSYRDGGLMVDGPGNRLAVQLWIATTPWAGALARLIDRRAPGRCYDRMRPEDLPQMGFFATSALTHVPGTLTMRGRGQLLLGIVALLVLGGGSFGAYYVWDLERERERARQYWTEGLEKDLDGWTARLGDGTFTQLPPCDAPQSWDLKYTLAVSRGPGGLALVDFEGGPPDLRTYPGRALFWAEVDGELRGIYVKDRLSRETDGCGIRVAGTSGASARALFEALGAATGRAGPG